nr:Ldh family oxidoreductase [Ruegeria atlantica]
MDEIRNLSLSILTASGFGAEHAAAITNMLATCQIDDCQSHELFRLFNCTDTMKAGKIDGHAEPVVAPSDNAIVRVGAQGGMSRLAFEKALPVLIEKTRTHGMAAYGRDGD